MKILVNNHSPSTKISDLLLLIFSISYFIETMQMTDTKNNAQANKSWAKQSPAMKYEILKRTTSKSDNFVLEE